METNGRKSMGRSARARPGLITIAAGIAGFILIALGLAFLVLRTPDLPAAQLEKTYAVAPSQFLILPSKIRVHLRASGPEGAPVLLLLHGSAASLFTWEEWRKQLAATHRVIAIDLPGHGLTGPDPKARYSPAAMADFVEELRATLGIGRFAIAGNSMGGEVAWRYAARFPDRMTALILLAPSGVSLALSDSERRGSARGFALAQVPVLNQIIRYVTPKSLVRQGLEAAWADDSRVSPEMVTLYWSMLRRSGNRAAFLERMRARPDAAAAEAERAEQMRLVQTPTLIIWGEQDAILPARAAPRFLETIRDSRLVLLPGIGHLPQEESAIKSAREAAGFLALWRSEAENPDAPIDNGGREP